MRIFCRTYSRALRRTRLSARSAIPCDVSGVSIEKPRLFNRSYRTNSTYLKAPMNRRTFTKTLALSAAAIGFGGIPAFAFKPAAPQFAITMDDFNWRNAVKLTAAERNKSILNVLQSN